MQVKRGQNWDHLRHIGNYVVAKQPDVIIQGGDWADMPSLSSYDVGRKSFEGRRYKDDIKAAQDAMDVLFGPIRAYNRERRQRKEKQWRPDLHLLLGNHEDRVTRAVESDPKLDGTIGLHDLGYERWGWIVHPFLEVVMLDGIAYSHYFTSGQMGRPVGTAAALLSKKHQSCIAFHQQGRQISSAQRADGTQITAIICGSGYPHHEPYLGPQGNRHFRGIILLYDVDGTGEFTEIFVTLDYLARRYSHKNAWKRKG